ncbi:hypothetical protein PIB30_065195 [Stylosanthes scabra]|uniref:Uncharacterized protein n=1 Tax=Stylosanthes scabra TaxID=79078 RepID=A0ABU6ZKQ5_9FABA|nr:hypothetical protein [Stylosanthes scabra]
MRGSRFPGCTGIPGSNFKCRWILDHSDAEVGVFLDSLLGDMEKHSRYDRLLQKMAEVEGAGPRSVLPHVRAPHPTSEGSSSSPAVPVPAPTTSVPLAPSAGAAKAKKKSSGATAPKPFSVAREEGAKEDPKRKRKVPEASAKVAALGVYSACEHEVSPIDCAFPPDYNFRAALDAGLTQGPARELLGPLLPEQLLGTAQRLACKLTACLQDGVENAFAAKVQMEKELAATKDQVDELTAERESALAAPLLNSKIKSLTQELELAEGEHLSAVARMKKVEERAKVQAAELESCRAALERERKRAE